MAKWINLLPVTLASHVSTGSCFSCYHVPHNVIEEGPIVWALATYVGDIGEAAGF